MSILDQAPDPPLRREHDILLTPAAVRDKIPVASMIRFNRCRLFLQVCSLADKADGSGKRVTRKAWQGVRDTPRRSTFDWPNQGNPSTSDWDAWRQVLQTVFGVHPANLGLPLSLGDWIDDPETWEWFFSPADERLYHRTGTHWTAYPRAPGRAGTRSGLSRFSASTGLLVDDPAADQMRCTIDKQGAFTRLTGASPQGQASRRQRGTRQPSRSMLLPQ
jgi:hypothetical protein